MHFFKKKLLKELGSSKESNTFAPQFGRRAEISQLLGYGVIGNTTDSGPVILGSSPGIPTTKEQSEMTAFLF